MYFLFEMDAFWVGLRVMICESFVAQRVDLERTEKGP